MTVIIVKENLYKDNMLDLSSVKVHLEVLNLSVTRLPSMKEYKKAYRELMSLKHLRLLIQ